MPYTESVIFGQPDFLYDMFVEFVMSSDSTMFSPWLLAGLVLGHSLFSVTCSVKSQLALDSSFSDETAVQCTLL